MEVLERLRTGRCHILGPILAEETVLEGLFARAHWLKDHNVRIELIWVRGHANCAGNEHADAAAGKVTPKPLTRLHRHLSSLLSRQNSMYHNYGIEVKAGSMSGCREQTASTLQWQRSKDGISRSSSQGRAWTPKVSRSRSRHQVNTNMLLPVSAQGQTTILLSTCTKYDKLPSKHSILPRLPRE